MNTIKITDRMAQHLANPSDDTHHMVVKGLKARGLIDGSGWLTTKGLLVKGALERNPGQRVFDLGQNEDILKGLELTYDEKRALRKAVWLVADDVRQSYPEVTNLEAIEHALSTASLDPSAGSAWIGDGEDPLTDAYRVVLTYPRVIRKITSALARANS